MQNPRGDVMSRLGGQIQPNNRQRFPRVEYVNRAGEPVNPRNGKPYNRPAGGPSLKGKPKRRGGAKVKAAKVAAAQKSPLPIKTFGVMFGGLNPIPTNPIIDPPPRVCFNCWQPGHAKKNCTRPVVARMCNNCGRRGEDLHTCPRCKDAHLRYLAHLQGENLPVEEVDDLSLDNKFVRNGDEMAYHQENMPDPVCDEVLQKLIQLDDRARQINNMLGNTEYTNEPIYSDSAYRQPEVKYVDTREYVKNPVSRYHRSRDFEEEEEEESRHRQHEEYEYERREGSYDERNREEYYRREREPSEERSVNYDRCGTSNHADSDSDPVQEVLQLAKSIAHLSPETQELIMKQVMAERQEKARLRAMKQRSEEDWP